MLCMGCLNSKGEVAWNCLYLPFRATNKTLPPRAAALKGGLWPSHNPREREEPANLRRPLCLVRSRLAASLTEGAQQHEIPGCRRGRKGRASCGTRNARCYRCRQTSRHGRRGHSPSSGPFGSITERVSYVAIIILIPTPTHFLTYHTDPNLIRSLCTYRFRFFCFN